MHALFGIVSLLVVVAIVSVLAKKQLGGTSAVVPGATPGATPQQQSQQSQQSQQVQQVQQQIQQSVEGTMQARPMPDDTK